MLPYVHQLAANCVFVLFIAEQLEHIGVCWSFLQRKQLPAAADVMKAVSLNNNSKIVGCKAELKLHKVKRSCKIRRELSVGSL